MANRQQRRHAAKKRPGENYAAVLMKHMSKKVCAEMDYNNLQMHRRIYNPAFKVGCLTAVCGGNQQRKVLDGGRARKLTPMEYERLQGLPDGYTAGCCDGARYKAIGNGWTVDVIAYIMQGLSPTGQKG